MSGIYIPGMEMPSSCYKCKIDCDLVSHIVRNMHPFWRYEKCPLVPVPEHGRLGDLDALKEKAVMRSEKCGCLVNVTDFVISAYDIENAPTIIPADKEGGT